MRAFTTLCFLAASQMLFAQSASFGGESDRRGANDQSRGTEASGDAPRFAPRGELERIGRYYGPRSTIRGVKEPDSVRVDFSRVTRFDLETHNRRHGPSR